MIDFASAYTALSTITGIAKSLADTHTQVKINEVAIELQGAILDLQSKMSAIQSEYQQVFGANERLKRQLVSHERWEQESARYTLSEFKPGVFVYALNPTEPSGEPQHRLCSNCYSNRKKSILQRRDMMTWFCPSCNLTLNV